MLTKTLAATAALSMLVGGGSAVAQSKSSVTAGPKQPIPYSQLDSYMKASPKARASKDWWAGPPTADTGLSTDTSATAQSSSAMSGASVDSSIGAPVNPRAPEPSNMPSTPPTDSGALPNDPASASTMTPQPK